MGRRGGLVGHRGDPWPSSCCDSGEVFRLRRHAFPESRLLSGPIRAWNTCGSGVGSPILELLQRTLESFHTQTPEESRYHAHADPLRRSWQTERNLRRALAARNT
jgi:hypothetical protein